MTTTADHRCDPHTDTVIVDGSRLEIRPIEPGDRDALVSFLHHLSAGSLYLRFFGSTDLDQALMYTLDLDDGTHFGLIALTQGTDEVVAQAAYVRCGADVAEVSFLVADTWQHHGIGTILLGRLAVVAADRGINRFVAEVLPVNRLMIDVFRHSGFPVTTRSRGGLVDVELSTTQAAVALISS